MIQHNQAYIITGAPGTGKTTLMQQLQKQYACIQEPARSIIEEQRLIGGSGVYDQNAQLFVDLMLSRMMHQLQQCDSQKITFFDRGIPDLIAYAKCFNLTETVIQQASKHYRYAPIVFLAPCWQDIFVNDEDRQLTFAQAQIFEQDIIAAYQQHHYQVIALPKSSISQRIDFILQTIGR